MALQIDKRHLTNCPWPLESIGDSLGGAYVNIDDSLGDAYVNIGDSLGGAYVKISNGIGGAYVKIGDGMGSAYFLALKIKIAPPPQVMSSSVVSWGVM
ncbi:hypothetical protein FXO38_25724 [Capsicum annuum]|nr:hypothetical protein FXO38_25724 [Capsicum annuum]